jgi:ABC-type amino acid transport substrate-binding protein
VPTPFTPLQAKEENNMKRLAIVLLIVTTLVMVLGACGGGNAGDDLLSVIEERGTIRVSTDANYEPQSFLDVSGQLRALMSM